ncbi:MAG: DUF5610 domain-containing protein [Duganella sp.]
MATPVSLTSASSNAGSSAVGKADTGQTKVAARDGTADVSPAAKAKAQLNASIVEASLTVSLKSSDNPMSMVLKTALTGINEALEADFGKDAIQNATSQDNTPEGTASRIVSLSTAFYDSYKLQHPGEDDETTLNNFMDTIKKGVEQGFKEAREILDGFKVLTGELSSNIDKTYDLIQQGFSDFAAARKAQPAADNGQSGTSIGTSAAATINASITPKVVDDGSDNRYTIDPKAV